VLGRTVGRVLCRARRRRPARRPRPGSRRTGRRDGRVRYRWVGESVVHFVLQVAGQQRPVAGLGGDQRRPGGLLFGVGR